MTSIFMRCSKFVIAALIFIMCASCAIDDGERGKVSAGLKGNQLYSLAPGFSHNVSPWIPFGKIIDFTAFMQKWYDPPPLTEKDKAEILIQLGVLKYERSWLTPKTLKIIDKYYHSALSNETRHGENTNVNETQLAYRDNSGIEMDASPCCIRLAQADVIIEEALPEVLVDFDVIAADASTLANRFSSFISSINLNRPSIDSATNSTLTPDALEQISKAIAVTCASGGCEKVTIHDDPIILEMAKGGPQNKDNEYSREAQNYPDPCEWLRVLYENEKNSAERLKIITAQKALGCRRNSSR